MKLVVVGTGQGGSNIADELFRLGKWLKAKRGVQAFTVNHGKPGVFAANLGEADLYGLRHIPKNDKHIIFLGGASELRGRGAGKINIDGAGQANKAREKIANMVRVNGNAESADAILVIATAAGGTGSGSVGVIVDLLKERMPAKPVYAMVVLPYADDYSNPGSMVNTATCLDRILNNSAADAVFMVDNQKFVWEDEGSREGLRAINRQIALSFTDLLCAGEEKAAGLIGEVIDANDVIRTLTGVTAIGSSFTKVPTKSLLRRVTGNGAGSFTKTHEQTSRAKLLVDQAFENLLVECGVEKRLFDADNVLGLLSGSPNEITKEVLEMFENDLAERVLGANRRIGTYLGRTSHTLGATLIISGVGEGVLMERIQWFYDQAQVMLGEVQGKRTARGEQWKRVAETAGGLPKI